MTHRLLDALRDRTRARHVRLDEALAFEDDLTIARYRTFLRGSLAVLRDFEPAVGRWIDLEPPSRVAALRADLGDDGDGDRPTIGAPAPSSLAEAWGGAYVVEGSALGGAVLAKAVEATLPGTSTRYLRLRGEDTGPAWRRFVERLGAFGDEAGPEDVDAACAFAEASFEAYHQSFVAVGMIR